MMKKTRILCAAAVMVLAVALAACSLKHSLSLELLEEASGIKVEAENAGKDDVVSSEGAIVVNEGDVIVISPCMDRGSFNLTIVSADDGTVVYDDIADGRIYFQIDALPGTYDVTVSGNGATGWMTVFSTSAEELSAQEESLGEALEQIDPSVLSNN